MTADTGNAGPPTADGLAAVAAAINRLAAAVEDGNVVARNAAEIDRRGWQALAVFTGTPAEPGESKFKVLKSLMDYGSGQGTDLASAGDLL